MKVTEDGRVQRELDVVLKDDKGAEKAKKAKADDGDYYVFEDLTPGIYNVSTSKRPTNRGGSLQIKVKAGETAEDEVVLKLMR